MSSSRKLSFHIFAMLLMAGTVFAIYCNSWHVPFVFDDSHNIAANAFIRLDELSWSGLYDAAFKSPSPSRAVAYISFALNYWLGQDDVTGYHIVNICIHLINGILVYRLLLVLLALDSAAGTERSEGRRQTIALLAAMIFVAHPIQTQAVTYVVQRMTSLSVMFYLTALLLYLAGRVRLEQRRHWRWWIAAFFTWCLALGCKQIAVTLPLILGLCEWLLFRQCQDRGTSAPTSSWMRPAWPVLAGVLALVLIPVAVTVSLDSFETTWFETVFGGYEGRMFTPLGRVVCQCRVVVFYLSLFLFPHPWRLNLIHDIDPTHGFPVINSLPVFSSLYGMLLLLGLLGCGVLFVKRRPLAAFCIFWFFVQMLLESTVLPLEMIFEHRLYLPSVGLALLAGLAIDSISGRGRMGAIVIGSAVVLFLGVGSWTRNRDWQDAVTVWTDVISKSPREPRGWNNRGKAFVELEEYERADADYAMALRYSKWFPEVINNRGNLWVERGNQRLAIEALSKVIDLQPGVPIYLYNRAVAYERFGVLDVAISDYTSALDLQQDFETARFNRGVVYGKLGKLDLAIQDFSDVIKGNSEHTASYMNRGDAYLQLAQHVPDAAVKRRAAELALNDFNEVIRLEPDFPQAYYNRANAHLKLGNGKQALEDYNSAIRLDPDLILAYYNRANLYSSAGEINLAIDGFTKTLELDPDHTEALNNRGLCYMQLKKFDLAIADFNRAMQTDPDSAIPYVSRGNVYTMTGRHQLAIRDYNQAIKLNADLAQAFSNRGISRAALGEHNAAIRDFSRALRLAPNDRGNEMQCLINRAMSHFAKQEFEQAQRDVRQYQELGGKPNPQFVEQLEQALKSRN